MHGCLTSYYILFISFIHTATNIYDVQDTLYRKQIAVNLNQNNSYLLLCIHFSSFSYRRNLFHIIFYMVFYRFRYILSCHVNSYTWMHQIQICVAFILCASVCVCSSCFLFVCHFVSDVSVLLFFLKSEKKKTSFECFWLPLSRYFIANH